MDRWKLWIFPSGERDQIFQSGREKYLNHLFGSIELDLFVDWKWITVAFNEIKVTFDSFLERVS